MPQIITTSMPLGSPGDLTRDVRECTVEANYNSTTVPVLGFGLPVKLGAQAMSVTGIVAADVGASIVGTSSSFAQDNNLLVMPGYTVVNPFLHYTISKGLVATLNVNNLFDKLGITESEDGSITEGASNIVRQRSIPGRTVAAGLRYAF